MESEEVRRRKLDEGGDTEGGDTVEANFADEAQQFQWGEEFGLTPICMCECLRVCVCIHTYRIRVNPVQMRNIEHKYNIRVRACTSASVVAVRLSKVCGVYAVGREHDPSRM